MTVPFCHVRDMTTNDDVSAPMAALEFALARAWQSLSRWREAGAAVVAQSVGEGSVLVLLNHVCDCDRPKTIHELMLITNRQDKPIVQYQLRKLIKAGLLEKSGTARKGVYYRATLEGKSICDDYGALWRDLPLRLLGNDSEVREWLNGATVCLSRLEWIYDMAARGVAAECRAA